MSTLENPMYEIGLILKDYFEREKLETIGHHVYEISLILHEYKQK